MYEDSRAHADIKEALNLQGAVLGQNARKGRTQKAMNESEVKQELRQRVANTTLAHTATELNISISYLHDVVRGRRKPGRKILKALGLKRMVQFVVAKEGGE